MKKVKWSTTMVVLTSLFFSACSAPDSGNAGNKETSMSLASPPPGSSLEATGVHEISYGVLKFLANGYNECNCNPRLDTLFFGSFISNQAIENQLQSEEQKGVYIHLCLDDEKIFYLALSGAESIKDSILKAEAYYPVGSGSYKFKANSIDNFFDSEVFSNPPAVTMKGSEIMDDRARFASFLTCDLNGDNVQDSLSTIPYGFMNRGELQELLTQSSAPYTALMMGYDPTMYPSVMRVLLASTKPNGANQFKLVKMDPAVPSHYALFLDRQSP